MRTDYDAGMETDIGRWVSLRFEVHKNNKFSFYSPNSLIIYYLSKQIFYQSLHVSVLLCTLKPEFVNFASKEPAFRYFLSR